MNPAVWLLLGWVVITPTRTDIVTVNGKGLSLYQHPTRAECFERPAVLEDLVSMDDPIRDWVSEHLAGRATHGPLTKKELDDLVSAHLKGFVMPGLPPVQVSELRGVSFWDGTAAQYRAMCIQFDPDNYRAA